MRTIDLTTPCFDYQADASPSITVNPPCVPVTWFNATSGELFVCISNALDANVWIGQLGTEIRP